MKQTLFIVLSVIIVTTILTTTIVRSCEEEKEIAVMRNDVYNMATQVEAYDEILNDFTDMFLEIHDDFDVSVNKFYKKSNDIDSARIYYQDVKDCYRIVEKYCTSSIAVEMK